MLRCGSGVPPVEESQQRPGSGAVHPVQHLVVEGPAGFKAFQAPLGLSLGVYPQNVAGIVPKEVGKDTCCACHRGGQRQILRGQHRLFPPGLLRFGGGHPFQFPAFPQAEGKGYLGIRPARSCDLPLGGQRLIVFRQCLQDHPITSPLSRVGTVSIPSTSRARKNNGVMFSGSE